MSTSDPVAQAFGQSATPAPSAQPADADPVSAAFGGTGGGAAAPHTQLDEVGQAFSDAATRFRQGVVDARNHPVQQAMNVLGAPQRFVGELARQVEMSGEGEGQNFGSVMHDIGESVFSPSEQINQRTTESIRKAVHAPTADSINKWVDGIGGLNDTEKQWFKTLAATGEDVVLQSISDPLTYLDGIGLLARIGGIAIKGTHMATAMHDAADAVGMGTAFSHLTNTAGKYAQGELITQRLARGIRNYGIRRDLDPFFTTDGKRARLSVENAWWTRDATNGDIMKKAIAAGPNDARDALVQFVYDHGSGPLRAAAAGLGAAAHNGPTLDLLKGNAKTLRTLVNNFHGATPEEQTEAFDSMRKLVLREGIANDTDKLLQGDPSLLKPGVAAGFDPHDLKYTDPVRQQIQRFVQNIPGMGAVSNFQRQMSRAGIIITPWIHEVRNVGQLARMAGGLHMVPLAIKKAAQGVDQVTVDRLTKIGAMPTWFGSHDVGYAAKIPGLNKYLEVANDFSKKLDVGYRAALLDTLDMVEGPSKTLTDEYLKGRTISERIGDPRNQDAFVHLFEAFGGWFPTFRLGIVPRNVAATLLEHPSRVVLPVREQADLNQNRAGREDTTYVMGGPTTDVSELAPQLIGMLGYKQGLPPYVTSPSTSGELGALASETYGETGTTPSKALLSNVLPLTPLGYSTSDIIQGLTGKSPTASPELRDKLIELFVNFITGNYEKRNPPPYIEQSVQQKIQQQGGV